MRVGGTPYRTLWAEGRVVRAIDQNRLPFDFVVVEWRTLEDAAAAIRTMQVRGAPLIGAAAAYGMALGVAEDPSARGLVRARERLLQTRPTAVNLRWALDRVAERVGPLPEAARAEAAFRVAAELCDEDVAVNRALGEHAGGILRRLAREKGTRAGTGRGGAPPLNVLTHCNAGWLATVDLGTATAGIYLAHDQGLPLHVWVDETRPRGQGARLTAWELASHGVPHTVVTDTTAPHLLARGAVDVVLVGTDRTTATGDVANKIGTYGVALAARDNGVPFYVAAPSSSIDFALSDGREIPIEERAPDEVAWVSGRTAAGEIAAVRVLPEDSPTLNVAFDVTPARLVTGIVTERGVAPASREGLAALFPERAG
ncbi:MAG: S-methyl-5-thioribose-1-phosphate isomerase [Longimicrobiales bacterium]|nr:S-methyl-5-thioribose-1-phosphate isomerase [Longimicrobiales bacterium]